MQTKTRAIVLHAIKYGDAAIIVDMLTERLGRMSFVCRLPRTKKAGMRIQLFQPLTMISIGFDHRPNAPLQHIKEVQMDMPFATIPFVPSKLAIGLFVAEFLLHATRGEQENAPLYGYIESSLRWLDAAEHHFASFHLVFMMRLTRFLGFFPNLENYAEGCFFDLRNGVFLRSAPLHSDVVVPSEASKIGLMMRMNYETMHLVPMSRVERNRCAEIILAYYRLHIPSFPELKSVAVLSTLYS